MWEGGKPGLKRTVISGAFPPRGLDGGQGASGSVTTLQQQCQCERESLGFPRQLEGIKN